MNSTLPSWFLGSLKQLNLARESNTTKKEIWDLLIANQNLDGYGERMKMSLARTFIRENIDKKWLEERERTLTAPNPRHVNDSLPLNVQDKGFPSPPQLSRQPTKASSRPIKHSPSTVWGAKANNYRCKQHLKGTIITESIKTECPQCHQQQSITITEIKEQRIICNHCTGIYTV